MACRASPPRLCLSLLLLLFGCGCLAAASSPAARLPPGGAAAARAATTVPVPAGVKEQLMNLTHWIMTLDVGSNHIHAEGTETAIFVNGNLARVLLAAHKIFGDAAFLAEGLRWCDTVVGLQHDIATSAGPGFPGGWWDTGYDQLYIADTGTAVTAMAVCHQLAPDAARKAAYLEAMVKFRNFVVHGCLQAPNNSHYGTGCPPKGQGWVHTTGSDVGALGDGYYKGALNLPAYTISTATTGSCFFPHLAQLLKGPDPAAAAELQAIANRAVAWILANRTADGGIPYIITPPSTPHPYQCISYSAESFMAVDLFFGTNMSALKPTVAFLLDHQNSDGSWGTLGSGDGERSPRALTLLQWFYVRYDADPRILAAINKYVAFVLANWTRYGVGTSGGALVSGFVGLAFADLVQPWATFGPL